MSGVAGCIRWGGVAVLPSTIEAMLATMRRRGPDRQATHVHANAAFGQALMATTPEAAHALQPWVHPRSGWVVVADTRLDNRFALLHALGFDARVHDEIGDAELLHAAFARWGDGCAERLLGDFAFAIWQPLEQRLFCARDPMGVRPFHYHHACGKVFVFASDAVAVVRVPSVPDDLDEGRIADALVGELEGVDQTSTFFAAVQRLPPAHTLRVDGRGLHLRRYWQPLQTPAQDLPGDERGWIDAVRDALEQAVSRRLRASVGVASMLSGGLDSSAIVTLAARARIADSGPPLATLSAIDSRDPDCAETAAVRAVIAALPVQAQCVELSECLSSPKFAVDAGLEPFDGSMTLIDALYARAAAGHWRVVLDGIPADNLYSCGDYSRRLARAGRWQLAWSDMLQHQRHKGHPLPVARAALAMLGARMPAAARAWRERRHDAADYHATLATSLIDTGFARRIDLRGRWQRYRDGIRASVQWSHDEQALSTLAAPYITAGIERYGRVAAAHGVEPRSPFLDRELIERHAWLPPSLRARAGQSKWALRQAMAGLLPDAVLNRRGKEHLGWRFNQAGLRTRREWLEQVCTGNELCDRLLVDRRKLFQALRRWLDHGDDRDFDALQSVVSMVEWVRTVRASRLTGG